MRHNTEALIRQALRARDVPRLDARLSADTLRLVQRYQRLRDPAFRTRARRWLVTYIVAAGLACLWIVGSGASFSWTPRGLSAVGEWLAPIGCALLPWLGQAIDRWLIVAVRVLQSSPRAVDSFTKQEMES